MKQKNIDLTIEENIEILKNQLQTIVSNCELPVSIISMIINEIANELNNLTSQRRQQIINSINEKMAATQEEEEEKE